MWIISQKIFNVIDENIQINEVLHVCLFMQLRILCIRFLQKYILHGYNYCCLHGVCGWLMSLGPAATVCAMTQRQEGFKGSVVLVCKEPHLPYDRSKLSKARNARRLDFFKRFFTIQTLGHRKKINKHNVKFAEVLCTFINLRLFLVYRP